MKLIKAFQRFCIFSVFSSNQYQLFTSFIYLHKIQDGKYIKSTIAVYIFEICMNIMEFNENRCDCIQLIKIMVTLVILKQREVASQLKKITGNTIENYVVHKILFLVGFCLALFLLLSLAHTSNSLYNLPLLFSLDAYFHLPITCDM